MASKRKSQPTSPKAKKRSNQSVMHFLIDGEQQRALTVLSFMHQVPTANLVRDAIDLYLSTKGPSAEDVEGFVKLVRDSVRRSGLGRVR